MIGATTLCNGQFTVLNNKYQVCRYQVYLLQLYSQTFETKSRNKRLREINQEGKWKNFLREISISGFFVCLLRKIHKANMRCNRSSSRMAREEILRQNMKHDSNNEQKNTNKFFYISWLEVVSTIFCVGLFARMLVDVKRYETSIFILNP